MPLTAAELDDNTFKFKSLNYFSFFNSEALSSIFFYLLLTSYNFFRASIACETLTCND